MGVRMHDVVMIGFDIGADFYDDNEWDKEDPLYEKYDLNRKSKSGDLVIFYDGYGGNYLFVGKLIDVDYYRENGLSQSVLSESSEEFEQGQNEVKQLIKNLYGIDVEPKFIVMTHYT
ncbi:hypothetical protein ACFQZE_06765 [Paenibacillus sp. GCM10027627]|uniref:hypothetical protein n=1 Tax=unclassified Paenibacillus TaxID=185978 RepID=UPI003632DB45